jgi:arylsulfatase A-like enzyme
MDEHGKPMWLKKEEGAVPARFRRQPLRIYVVGSLRQGRVRETAEALREHGYDVFDDWHACGPDGDTHWQAYETERGRTYVEALEGRFAYHNFRFDWSHLVSSDVVVLVSPPSKVGGFSAGVEIGWAAGKGKRTYILLDGEPDRWELMAKFADQILYTIEELVQAVDAYARIRT